MNLHDKLHEQKELIPLLDATRRAAEEAKAEVAHIKATLTDLEDQLFEDAKEERNEASRKSKLAQLKRESIPYRDTDRLHREAQAKLRAAEADFEDAQQKLKSCEKAMHSLGQILEREAADVLSTAYQCYARGAVDIRRAAEAQLAAKTGGAPRG